MCKATDMTEIKNKLSDLKKIMPDADETLCKFSKMFSYYLNPQLVPEGFLMSLECFIYDLRTKIPSRGIDERLFFDLIGYPIYCVVLCKMLFFSDVIDEVLPKNFLIKVKKLIEEKRKHEQSKFNLT